MVCLHLCGVTPGGRTFSMPFLPGVLPTKIMVTFSGGKSEIRPVRLLDRLEHRERSGSNRPHSAGFGILEARVPMLEIPFPSFGAGDLLAGGTRSHPETHDLLGALRLAPSFSSSRRASPTRVIYLSARKRSFPSSIFLVAAVWQVKISRRRAKLNTADSSRNSLREAPTAASYDNASRLSGLNIMK